MFLGAHVILYSKDAEADRAFLRDVLAFPHVDAGHGWLIFALPPAEVALHPDDDNEGRELYLICESLDEALARLKIHGVPCTEPQRAPWGTFTHFTLPGGGKIGLYEARHPLALGTWKEPGS